MLRFLIFFLLVSSSLSFFSLRKDFHVQEKIPLLFVPDPPSLPDHSTMVFITRDADINITIYSKNKNFQVFTEFDEANYSVVSYKCGVWVQFTDNGCLVSFFTGNTEPFFDFTSSVYNSTFVYRKTFLNPHPEIEEGSLDGGTHRVNLFDMVNINTVEGIFPISGAFDYWTGYPIYWISKDFGIKYEVYRYSPLAPNSNIFDFSMHDFNGCPNATYLNRIYNGGPC